MPRSDPSRKRCAIYTRKSSEEGLEQEFNSLQDRGNSFVGITVVIFPNQNEFTSVNSTVGVDLVKDSIDTIHGESTEKIALSSKCAE